MEISRWTSYGEIANKPSVIYVRGAQRHAGVSLDLLKLDVMFTHENHHIQFSVGSNHDSHTRHPAIYIWKILKFGEKQ